LYEQRTTAEQNRQRYFVYAFGRIIGYEEKLNGSAATKYWTITDHLGSVMAEADFHGTILDSTGYADFGAPGLAPAARVSGHEMLQRYTGKDYDPATGLTFFNARWYSSELGRFITEDPIRDGVNWFIYCNNNPMRYIDPTGLDAGPLKQLDAWDGKKNDLEYHQAILLANAPEPLTDEQWEATETALNGAIHNLDNAIDQINNFIAGNIEALDEDLVNAAKIWLGDDFVIPTLSADGLLDHLVELRSSLTALDRDSFLYDADEEGYAYTNPLTGTIIIYDGFLEADPDSGSDNQQGILVHEGSHDVFGLAAFDFEYGQRNSIRLPDRGFRSKSNNADNWEYFYEDLFSTGR